MAGSGSDPRHAPTVLVVLVVHNAATWLRDCLAGLASQTYRRLAVLAVDNQSDDGSRRMLEQALGPRRVLELAENRGVAGSLRVALDLSAAGEADFVLVLHDDTVLDPDAVERLVEAANLAGVDRVGVVGPKIVDWDSPRILREVGRSTDRFGHPSTPLQDGELDQGQFDRVIEVLFVSSAAMLVSRECLKRIGPPDERFGSHHEDLDLCWRARVAGYRVLMTPLARARHLSATQDGRRPGDVNRSERYFSDRSALAAMMKNYGLRSLALMLPVYAVLGMARLAWLALSRRFDEAVELLSAWGWNLAHLPGTIRRRFHTQRSRRVPDRAVRRFMEPTLRSPRLFDAAGRIVAEQRELEAAKADESVQHRLGHQGVSLVRAHPVLVASILGVIVGAAAYRGLFGSQQLAGGALPAFPAGPDGFFREFLSGVRTTGFGGTDAASPALAVLGALSALMFSSPAIALKVVLGGAPVLGAVLLYRAMARQTGSALAAVAGASAYVLSAVVLWAYSDGRLALLVAVGLMPAIADRMETAFGAEQPSNRLRFAVGLGALLALAGAFEPGVLSAAALLLVVQLTGGSRRWRGLGLSLSGVAAAGVLLFPMLPGLAAGGGRALSSWIGAPDMSRLARFALGSAPGGGPAAWFLPVAAIAGLSLVRGEHRASANRAAAAAAAGMFAAWASAAGWLPAGLSNAPTYEIAAAASASVVVAHGVASVVGVRTESFGPRQIGSGVLAATLVLGIALQAAIAMIGGWGIGGPDQVSAAWAVAQSGVVGEYRVLWIGSNNGRRFDAPGGDPQGLLADGARSVRYAVTGKGGATALDLGRGPSGPGDDSVHAALGQIISGSTRHGGALLAPLGVRFVIGGESDLPPGVRAELDRQIDLDLIQSAGLRIYQNARALPLAGELTGSAARSFAEVSSTTMLERLPNLPAYPLTRGLDGWDGAGPGGMVFLSMEFSSNWRLDDGNAVGELPRRAFGWATSFEAPAGAVHVRSVGQRVRTLEMEALGLLWAAALWITRKPMRA